ncbi:MAG: radical SAM protein [Clostridiales bacterium]|jgi:DNA repair photolyase|nr:radical SAM protein [Clostridiales bacterium]
MHYVDAKGILSARNGMNLYRGCTHGCIYCDSRSACYRMAHDFEDVEVKRNAPQLLESALRKKRARCMIATGSMCDPYLPLERTERLTRRCLEIVDRCGFGFSVITKSDLVLRDLDLLKRINARTKCVVQMTLTTCDENLCRILEPNVATTRRRFEVLETLRDEGIPTVVWLCPILPFLNDTEENLRGILDLCFRAGVKGILCFSMGVTLRQGDREYFYQKLDEHFPGVKARYVRTFGDAYVCNSPRNAELMDIFRRECAARGVMHRIDEVFSYLCAFEDSMAGEQLTLF